MNVKHLFVCVVESIDKNKKFVEISKHTVNGEQFLKDSFPGTIFPGTNSPETIFLGDHFSGDHFSRGPFFRVPFFCVPPHTPESPIHRK